MSDAVHQPPAQTCLEDLYELFDVTIGDLWDRARLWGVSPVDLLP